MNFASRPALTAILLALTSFSLFSVGDTAIKALSVHYDTVTIAFYIGTMIVGLTLLLTPFMGGVRRIITLPDRKFHILRGCILTVQFYLMIYAFSVMSLAKAYALLFAAPLITVLLAWLMLKEKPGPVQTILIAIGFAGVLLILRPGLIPLDWAAAGMVVAAAAFALSHIIVRYMKSETQPLLAWPLYSEGIIALCALPFFLRNPILPTLPHLGLFLLASAIGLAGLAMLGAALRLGKTNAVAPFQYVQMLWAVGLGYLFFGDVPDIWMLAGSTLIIGSGLWLIRHERQPAVPPAMEHNI